MTKILGFSIVSAFFYSAERRLSFAHFVNLATIVALGCQ